MIPHRHEVRRVSACRETGNSVRRTSCPYRNFSGIALREHACALVALK